MLSCQHKQEQDQLQLSERFQEGKLGRGKVAWDNLIGSPGISAESAVCFWRSHLSREVSAGELPSRETVVSRISMFFANSMEKGVLEIVPRPRVRCSAVAMFYPRGSCFSAVGAGICVFLGRCQGTGMKGATRINIRSVLPLQMFISFMGRLVSGDLLSPSDGGVFLSIARVYQVWYFCCCFCGGPGGAGIKKSQRCHLEPDGPVLKTSVVPPRSERLYLLSGFGKPLTCFEGVGLGFPLFPAAVAKRVCTRSICPRRKLLLVVGRRGEVTVL